MPPLALQLIKVSVIAMVSFMAGQVTEKGFDKAVTLKALSKAA